MKKTFVLAVSFIFIVGCSTTVPVEESSEATVSQIEEIESAIGETELPLTKVRFNHPKSWDFSCCFDKDFVSSHFLYSSEEHNQDEPFISIVEHSLVGCPKDELKCTLDQVVEKRYIDKFFEVKRALDGKAQYTGVRELKTLSVSNLEMYKTVDLQQREVETYLFSTQKGIVEFSFVNRDKISDEMVDEILESLRAE